MVCFDNSIAYTTANVKCFSENLLFLKTKITPVKLPSLKARTDLQNEFADEDTSSSVIKISIPQLYDLVKGFEQIKLTVKIKSR